MFSWGKKRESKQNKPSFGDLQKGSKLEKYNYIKHLIDSEKFKEINTRFQIKDFVNLTLFADKEDFDYYVITRLIDCKKNNEYVYSLKNLKEIIDKANLNVNSKFPEKHLHVNAIDQIYKNIEICYNFSVTDYIIYKILKLMGILTENIEPCNVKNLIIQNVATELRKAQPKETQFKAQPSNQTQNKQINTTQTSNQTPKQKITTRPPIQTQNEKKKVITLEANEIISNITKKENDIKRYIDALRLILRLGAIPLKNKLNNIMTETKKHIHNKYVYEIYYLLESYIDLNQKINGSSDLEGSSTAGGGRTFKNKNKNKNKKPKKHYRTKKTK